MHHQLRSVGHWLRNNVYWLLIALGIALLYLTSRPLLHDMFPRGGMFVTELAFASIIVSTFGLTIDKYQREEFVRLVNNERGELKRDIFLYAYGHTVPEQIRQEIRARILNCPYQREDMRIEWEFSVADGRNEHVVVEKRHTFVLRNNTGQFQTYKYELNQITASENEVLVAHEFQCLKFRRKNAEEISFGPRDIADDRPLDDPHVRKVSREFGIDPWEAVEIFYSIKETRRAYADDFYASQHPVIGITLVTIRVNPPLVLEVSAAWNGKSLKTRAEHDSPRRYSWQIEEGMLPYQGIAFSWSPRHDTAKPPIAAPAEKVGG